MTQDSVAEATPIPVHQWTHMGGKVLLIKCVEKGKGYNRFPWPKEGTTRCPKAQANPTEARKVTGDMNTDCASGGLFGWPWGIGIGGGKNPDYRADWLVFAADPGDVIGLKDKAKAVGEVEIVYYGDALGALMFTFEGRVAWITKNSCGSASATGYSGSAAATGESGSAAATGESGSASATGDSGSASATGYSGSASATGWSGSASATGESGSAAATGWSGSASATGTSGSAAATGTSGSASATGTSGSASATGDSGSASATGISGSASATGERSIAALTGQFGKITVGPESLGAVTAQEWAWHVHAGAVVACRWKKDEKWCHRLLVADELGLTDGQVVNVVCGEIQPTA